MIEDKIILRTSISAPFQQLYIYKNDERVDQIGAQVSDLSDILMEAMEKYNIHQLDVAGFRGYAEGLIRDFKKQYATQYSIDNIVINYV